MLLEKCNHPIIVSDGEHNIHRRYDQFGEIASASADDNITTIRYGHNNFGDISEKLQNEVYQTGYRYNSIGKIVQSSMPSGRTESYTYTPNGNLDTITSEGKTFDYDYYDTGYIKSITYPNGLKTSYEYDNINRVTKITTALNGTTITEEEYTYDNNGNIVEVIKNGEYATYTYDALDRLISVTYTDGSCVDYEYDALNNRIKEIYSNGSVKFYVYNEKNQLERITLNNETTDTFTYNETGAVVTHNDKTYTYDEWDRMSGYTDGTESYTYRYDANGIRTGKNDKQYIIDINNNVVAETDSTGAITDEVLWGHQPLARKINGNWYYYIYNAHGDVIGLVDDAGTVVNTYEYTPWGEILSETETVENPIKYAGEYYDDELDMIYLRARYYNPQIGRFTSLDVEEGEISNPLDMNRYVYCRNNPVKYVDPSGLWVETAFDIASFGISLKEVWDNPNDGWNWLALVGDTIDFIPFVAGIGETVKGVKTTYKVANNFSDAKTIAKTSSKTIEIAKFELPSNKSKNYIKLKNGQGYKDLNGNIWKKDQLHKDHWDVTDKKGNKIREVDFDGNQIWPNGPKNKKR